MKDRNQLLLDFASDWTLDGDLLRCRSCKRAQIASRQDEDFVHRSDCEKNRTGGRPWTVLQSILLTMPSGQSVMDLLAAATAQRDELLRVLKVERAKGGHADESPVICRVFWGRECDCGWAERLNAIDGAIARAQSGKPAPVQQPSTKDVALQGGECAFFDELPKGPSIGRFSASDRAELDELKRKAFKAGES